MRGFALTTAAAVLGLNLALVQGFARDATERLPAADEAMARRIADLREKARFFKDRHVCMVKAVRRRLDKADPYSASTPHEITFYYSNHKILALVNSTGDQLPKVQCLKANNYVYLFFDTLGYSGLTSSICLAARTWFGVPITVLRGES